MFVRSIMVSGQTLINSIQLVAKERDPSLLGSVIGIYVRLQSSPYLSNRKPGISVAQ